MQFSSFVICRSHLIGILIGLLCILVKKAEFLWLHKLKQFKFFLITATASHSFYVN